MTFTVLNLEIIFFKKDPWMPLYTQIKATPQRFMKNNERGVRLGKKYKKKNIYKSIPQKLIVSNQVTKGTIN